MKATTLLRKQHAEAKSMFKKLEKGAPQPKPLVEKLCKALLAHMIIEEELFYPAVKALDPDLVLESIEEHAAARFEMRRLAGTESAEEAFHARVVCLREMIEHHVDEEHDELFPEVDAVMSKGESELLATSMSLTFESLVEEPLETLFGRAEGQAVGADVLARDASDAADEALSSVDDEPLGGPHQRADAVQAQDELEDESDDAHEALASSDRVEADDEALRDDAERTLDAQAELDSDDDADSDDGADEAEAQGQTSV